MNQNSPTDDGSLAITVSGDASAESALHANWLPAPAEEFTLFLRAYWSDASILIGTWERAAVTRS